MARFDVEITEHTGAGGAIALIIALAIGISCCGDSNRSESRSNESTTYNSEYVDYDEALNGENSYDYDYDDSQAIDEVVNEQHPKALADCHIITGDHERIGEGKDSYGHVHERALILSCFYLWGENEGVDIGYATFALERQYTTMSCSFIHSGTYRTQPSQVKIYLDDTLVYTSPTMIKTSEAVNAEIDVTGANTVRIELVGVDMNDGMNETIIDASLY